MININIFYLNFLCAPIEKGLAILFTLSRLFFVGISIPALIMENEISDRDVLIMPGYLIISVLNFFNLWSLFCCADEEEKECWKYTSDDACFCTLICFSGELCVSCDNGENYLNLFMLGVMLFLFFFRFYIWILVKCCGKKSIDIAFKYFVFL